MTDKPDTGEQPESGKPQAPDAARLAELRARRAKQKEAEAQAAEPAGGAGGDSKPTGRVAEQRRAELAARRAQARDADQADDEPSAGDDTPAPASVPGEALLDVAAPIAVRFGRTVIALADAAELQHGQRIELDAELGAPAELWVDGRLYAHGELLESESGGDWVFRVTTILPA